MTAATRHRWAGIHTPALYYIHTFDRMDRPATGVLYRNTTDVITAGCRLIQLRFKGAWSFEVAELLRLFINDFDGSDTKFIMNDRVEWALEIGAHGVHVGESSDTPPATARQTLGKSALVGATTKTPEQLAAAIAGDVDYVSYGALFPSSTKPDAVAGSFEHLDTLPSQLPDDVKLCAIGGISEARIPAIFQHKGVDLVAVGAAIQTASDPELETLKIIDAIRLASGDTSPHPARLVGRASSGSVEDDEDDEDDGETGDND
ncbi:MAG: thiamine phosphate synthase [bacterium]